MATVISILHPSPTPLSGESGLVLSLTFKPPTEGVEEQGYRMVARAEETGRVIGRWVSDCALTVTEAALLWCSKSLDDQGEPLWSFAMGTDSIDWQRVLDTVTEYQPGEHPQIPPRQVIAILAGNFPANIAAPPRRALTGPVVRRPGQPAPARPQIAERAPEPVQKAPAPRRALPEPPPQVEKTPKRARATEPAQISDMGEEEQELTVAIREMYRALKAGASAEEVRTAMLQIAGPDDDEDEDEDDLTTWDEDEDSDDEDVEDEDSDDGDDEDDDDGDEDDDEGDDGDDDDGDGDDDDEGDDEGGDEGGDEDGEDEDGEDEDGDETAEVKALGADDDLSWDRGMRLYAADQRAYDKLARTHQRAAEIQQRVQAHLAAQAAAQAAAERAALAKAEEPEVEAPKPRRNLRRLAQAIEQAEQATSEEAPSVAPEALDAQVEEDKPKRRRAKKSA
jgi:hypothetical protein